MVGEREALAVTALAGPFRLATYSSRLNVQTFDCDFRLRLCTKMTAYLPFPRTRSALTRTVSQEAPV